MELNKRDYGEPWRARILTDLVKKKSSHSYVDIHADRYTRQSPKIILIQQVQFESYSMTSRVFLKAQARDQQPNSGVTYSTSGRRGSSTSGLDRYSTAKETDMSLRICRDTIWLFGGFWQIQNSGLPYGVPELLYGVHAVQEMQLRISCPLQTAFEVP